MRKEKEFDLLILGGGAAAFGAAMKADELGAKTAMIEEGMLGGTCVNVGCLPTKHLLHIAERLHSSNNHQVVGLKSGASIDFKTIIEEKDRLIDTLRREKYAQVLDNLANVTLIQGHARFVAKNKVEVNGETYNAERFIVATGSSTFIPPIKGIEGTNYLTNIEALSLKRRPESMIVLGGGPLGVEFAQMYARFGTKVCLLQKAERLVIRAEPELAGLLQRYLEAEGIEIHTSVEVKSAQKDGQETVLTVSVEGETRIYRAEVLLVATGRRPNTSGFGLELTGVKLDSRGGIVVDEEMCAAENVWAAGDVKSEPMLETVAAKEGSIAANNALYKPKKEMDYTIIPHAVFTDPQLVGVGLTDEQAIQKDINCRCHTIPIELVPKARAIKDTRGAIKMVIDDKTKKIIGVHILSSTAADLIHEASFILKENMTIYDVIDTLHVFPTMSESIKIAAQSFVRDVSKMACCIE
ncbi:MAG: mercury(II) reductase [Candidatus Heimdallarchaeota archaeon]